MQHEEDEVEGQRELTLTAPHGERVSANGVYLHYSK